MDISNLVERSAENARDYLTSRFVFRLDALEAQFNRLYPTEDFGRAWPSVDRYVQQYPELFDTSAGEEAAEGLELACDADGEFEIPDVRDAAARAKIRRALEFLVGRILLDGEIDVARVPGPGR
jgi:hypothetical protein